MVGSSCLQDSQSLTPITPAPHSYGRPPIRSIRPTIAAAHLNDHLALLLAPLHVRPHTHHATPSLPLDHGHRVLLILGDQEGR